MIMEAKFYKCQVCGNVIVKLVDGGVDPSCCGQPMKLLNAMEVDGAREKHLPVVCRNEDGLLVIKVGETPHPMTPEHHICFVAVETKKAIKVIYLDPEKPAEACYCDCHEEVTAFFEYCNLHGLWKTTDIPCKEKCCKK